MSGLGRPGTGTLKVDGKAVATKTMAHTLPMILQWDESFDIGSDTLTGVNDADYQPPFTAHRQAQQADDQGGPAASCRRRTSRNSKRRMRNNKAERVAASSARGPRRPAPDSVRAAAKRRRTHAADEVPIASRLDQLSHETKSNDKSVTTNIIAGACYCVAVLADSACSWPSRSPARRARPAPPPRSAESSFRRPIRSSAG